MNGMNTPKLSTRIRISLDTFFKQQAKEFFGACGYQVESEHEMLKMPKRLDVLVIETGPINHRFEILGYFNRFNLISYKSHRDRVRFKDICDMSIYLNLYIRETPEADYGNTSMTLICSSSPRKFITAHREHFREVCPGHFVGKYGIYDIHIINIESVQLAGPDGVFLSGFCRNVDRLFSKAEIKKFNLPPQIVDKLLKGITMRLTVFEGQEDGMVPVADVTEIVRPQLEQAWNSGIAKGKKEGMKEGKKEGKKEGLNQAAKGMKVANVSIDIIRKSTGLTIREIKEL